MIEINKSSIFPSGLYWKHTNNRRTISRLAKKTIKNFRGSDSGIGTSFSDILASDIEK